MKVSKLLAVLSILTVLGFVGGIGTAKAYTNSSDITGTVNVPSACIVSLNTESIGFGNVTPSTDTGDANEVVTITNDGNTLASTTISGTDWADGNTIMTVGQTEYSESAFTYGNGNALATTDTAISDIAAGASQDLYFGVGIPSGQATGTYTQTITVTMSC